MTKRNPPLVRPLRARPGARFECHADGLCCTDIHAIGPISAGEAKRIRRFDALGARYDDEEEEFTLCTAADGGCRFLRADGLCQIHAERGPENKPHGCREFPYSLTATPQGGRVVTMHRCPCRTLGRRKKVDLRDAESSIRDGDGPLESHVDVRKVRVARGTPALSFERYVADVETPLLASLAKTKDLVGWCEATPFPKLRGHDWVAFGESLVEARDGAAFGVACAWFGDTILHLRDGRRARPPARPWGVSFDRAEARAEKVRGPKAMLRDWLADQLWSLRFVPDGTLRAARHEWATRLVIAQTIQRQLAELGVRRDRAMAEAITVIELIGESEHWGELRPRFPQ